MSALRIETDDAALAEMFAWATSTARRFVVEEGSTGPLDVSEATPPPYLQAVYRAGYHAGYAFRSGYYLRDFAHQAVGAQLLGLGRENRAMLDSFIRTATPEHGGWPVWALNFDGVTPLAIDYHGPGRFVRELPAAFELVELVHVLYRWSGDRTLGGHREHWRRTLGEFVAERDVLRPNGVAEAGGPGIFDGAASYNERPGEHLLEAGDGIGAQYAALRHAAALELALGEKASAREFGRAAESLAAEFTTRWGRVPAAPDEATTARAGAVAFGGLVSAWLADGRPVAEWLREATWFLPLKGLLTEDDARREAVLDEIDAACRDERAPSNIEALSYLPDVFLRHGRADAAYAWMREIHARRDDPHEVPQQVANGDYPELAFALVGQIVAGLLGLEPDAGSRRIATRPALPSGIRRLVAIGVPFGRGLIDVGWAEGEGHWLENRTPDELLWSPNRTRDRRFRDPHLAVAAGEGDLVRVRPGERRTVSDAADRDREATAARARSTGAAAARGR
ncbi:hypothetical protein [Agromyces lapidis]|uniref:Uncharacterized protein n=1 Tax=Agromyces lapidis TaxID=279574 RepID=A0ABV5SU25_9MICO|nr:hypothetical protein [Agromyces lapidis]